MQLGTPEQIKIVRHRRKVWLVVCSTIVLLSITPPLIVLKHFTTSATVHALFVVWFKFGWICGGVLILICTKVYWRCPTCRREFSKGSGGKFCDHCNTRFAV